jgi:hypothetical protein
MKKIDLNPHQIITLNDYPVFSVSHLKKYFRRCRLGNLPLIPVIKKNIVKKHLNQELLRVLHVFEKANPKAEYFMLDGTHRTTALTIVGRQISVLLYENSKDITRARELLAKGLILESATLNYSLEKNCEVLANHFNQKPYFMTVEQKTRKMVEETVIPKNMIDYYQTHKS